MVAKVYADRLNPEDEIQASEPPADPELEAEVAAIAAWFEALPRDLQAYFDREAASGRRAYGQA